MTPTLATPPTLDPIPAAARPATARIPDRTATELPLPVVRWLEIAWPGGMDEVASLEISGSIRIRRGRLWLPGDATMRFGLGVGYVSDLRIGLGPLTAIRGLDAYVDRTGMTRVGSRADLGPEIDQGAFLALWAQSILYPGAWRQLSGLRWTAVDDSLALVSLPFRRGTETATIRFDPDDAGFPVAFEADRYKVVGGPKIGWRADYADWHWREGLAMPTRMVVTWSDNPGPWFDMRVEDVVVNPPLEAHVERARQAIAAERAGRRDGT